MDWKYILSLNTDDLNDDDKDELYNTVTWFDCDGSHLEENKYKALIRVCQEILKYKGEQVETLLHELEEMTIKQAEDEAKRQESEAELKSTKSKKSSSIEYENLEQKYLEAKSKIKKLNKLNEKQETEVNKLNNRIKLLEQENRRLQNEIQSKPIDVGSESDISESIKEKQQDLVETLHNKNRQISELLRDIEEVEKENSILRDKLLKVRDELSIATHEIVSLTELLKDKESVIDENKESINKITLETDTIRKDFNILQKEKFELEDKTNKILDDFNKKIVELQEEIASKDNEIDKLKARYCKEPSLNSSLSSLPKDEPEKDQSSTQSHLTALQKLLNEREKQLIDVQNQLQIATKEMEEATKIITKLKMQKTDLDNKVAELKERNLEQQKQAQKVHDRCQKLNEELNFAEESVRIKDNELKDFLSKLKENGQIDVAINLNTLSEIKTENRLKDKQIKSLVKTTNKLQEACDELEKENYALRETLGISENDTVNFSGFTSKQKRLKKEMEHLKSQLVNKDELILQHKSQIQKLNKTVSSLSNQIVELGHKPQSIHPESNLSKVSKYTNEDMQNLVEENEALRKGLHEIMNSVNAKKSRMEIKSETLEQLLRALDVKHVTGWYHPAMRLQAELHNLEGVNSELREQLKQARKEVNNDYIKDDDCSSNINETLSDDIEGDVNKLFDTSDTTKKININFVHKQVLAWLINVTKSNSDLNVELDSVRSKLKVIEEEHEIVLEKLKILICESDEDKVKKINDVIASNVTLNRKVVHLENESKKLYNRIENMEKNLCDVERNYIKSLSDLQNKNISLESNLSVLQSNNNNLVSFDSYKNIETKYNDLVLKYRNLAAKVEKDNENQKLEYSILSETKKSLEQDKADIMQQLAQTKAKYNLFDVKNYADKEEKLAQKLADAEVKEIAERQRANHINNLYELVKEQLTKSEEKFKEFSKFNEELLKKNITLQEQIKTLEDNLCDYIDNASYHQAVKSNNDLIKEKESLCIKINNLETEINTLRKEKEYERSWNDAKEQELQNVKHQIVDLVSTSDDKVIIAQLSGDVLQNRKLVEYYKINLNGLNAELEKVTERNKDDTKRFEEEKRKLEEKELACRKKICHLQNVLTHQKLQFYGYVPITSEEMYVNNILNVHAQKHETFLALEKAKELQYETYVIKEQLNIELEYAQKQREFGSDSHREEYKKMSNWMQEKKSFQISELRLKRQLEYKESQLQHYIDRVKIQDEQILKLDQELLQFYKNTELSLPVNPVNPVKNATVNHSSEPAIETPTPPPPVPLPRKISRSVSVQTTEAETEPPDDKGIIVTIKSELIKVREELGQKDSQIDQLKSKITEHEMTISMFRKQIGDKQSQISFYERHIMELQSKKDIVNDGAGGDNFSVRSEGNQCEEILILKNSIKSLQDTVKSKDQEIIKYQTLLKTDRDKHSLAAASLQEELQNLQKQLAEEKQTVKSLEDTFANSKPNRAALEQYIGQVHALEKHTSDLHTKLASLEAQLQSSRQETVRWRTMANDRLTAMEELRNNLDQQHQKELEMYKSDTEKLREIGNDEINCLRQIVLRQKGELTGRLDSDIQRLIREKDDKIHEMIVKMRQMKNVKKPEHAELDLISKKELESANELLQKENELLKRRYEQLSIKEKNTREEINNLKSQLLKKPISARSDKSDKSIKDQLHKKIAVMEKEISDLKQNLNEQIAINETHQIHAKEDFNKWKKMKQSQQTVEKLKNKLKERDVEYEKLQQTSSGYRLLIERLEREKRNLENRVKTLKSSNINAASVADMEALKLENIKLSCDIEALKKKMEMHQHHAGSIGAAMLQEKLEAQERKIAILELATKGTSELRSELERLQTSISTIQKSNLRLEAENLELKLDLEKSNKEVPHLHQQIQHLENYVDVLKTENSLQQSNVKRPQPITTDVKKISELERTVFILKRVVEKLQTENKRLVSGKRPLSDRSPSAEKLKRDYLRLKEQHSGCTQKIQQLERDLEVSKNTLKNISASKNDGENIALSNELISIKEQLEVKSSLLDKVKLLLHRAAAKEKTLLEEISILKRQQGLQISPIPEDSNQ